MTKMLLHHSFSLLIIIFTLHFHLFQTLFRAPQWLFMSCLVRRNKGHEKRLKLEIEFQPDVYDYE